MELAEALKLLRGGKDGVGEWNRRRKKGEAIPILSGADGQSLQAIADGLVSLVRQSRVELRLHFTDELLATLGKRGIRHVMLTLLVGAGTFLPIRSRTVAEHQVPAERYAISTETAAAVAETRAHKGRVVAVGTTAVRALESAADGRGGVAPGAGRTALVIAPGYHFQVVDALLTNLHLPRSSLLALVAAFAGTEPTLAAYAAATDASYRFYSYGDAMLVL